jgi:hypothetical protein
VFHIFIVLICDISMLGISIDKVSVSLIHNEITTHLENSHYFYFHLC